MQTRYIDRLEGIVRSFRGANTEIGEADKKEFHRLGMRLLREIATKGMKLATGQFDIRSNKAGMAVLGEVTLHTDTMYIQLCQSSLGYSVMYRTCQGRKDYTGGANQWTNIAGIAEKYNVLES